MKTISKQINQFQTQAVIDAQVEGKREAFLGRPRTLAEFMAGYINNLHQKVQIEINRNNIESQPLSGKALANKTQQDKNEQLKIAQADLCDQERDQQILKNQKDNCGCTWWEVCKRYTVYFFIALLAFAEGFFVYQALINSSYARIISLLIAFGIGAGLFLSTDILALYILKAKSTRDKWLRGILISAIVLVAFYGLGLLRKSGMEQEAYLNENLGGIVPAAVSVNAMVLAGLSLFIFIIGLLITIKYRPSEEEKENFRTYFRIRRKLKECAKEIGRIRNEMKDLNDHANDVSYTAMTNAEDTFHSTHTYVAIANQAVTEYIKSNMKYGNGHFPDFFANPPKFTLSSFNNNNPSSHNQNEII